MKRIKHKKFSLQTLTHKVKYIHILGNNKVIKWKYTLTVEIKIVFRRFYVEKGVRFKDFLINPKILGLMSVV